MILSRRVLIDIGLGLILLLLISPWQGIPPTLVDAYARERSQGDEPPVIEWVSTADLDDRIVIEVGGSGNGAFEKVLFLRWEPQNEQFILISDDEAEPYQAIILKTDLLPEYNQIFIRAFDVFGNASKPVFMLVYNIVPEHFGYFPLIFRQSNAQATLANNLDLISSPDRRYRFFNHSVSLLTDR